MGSVLRLAQAALDAGHGVSRHVMDAWTPITACASNASARGIAEAELVAGARLGGQFEHAAIMAACDHFLAFT